MSELDKIELELLQVLSNMSTEEYHFKKCVILTDAIIYSDNVYNFMRKVFEVADKKRPLLLGMKGGVM